MLLVMAGKAVDDFINALLPFVEEGDIIIDGGNSHFPDTTRRTQSLKEKGIRFVGTGVSGGEEGARFGPSLMPGGNEEAWPYIKDIFQAVAAKSDGEPCCDWVGDEGLSLLAFNELSFGSNNKNRGWTLCQDGYVHPRSPSSCEYRCSSRSIDHHVFLSNSRTSPDELLANS